MDHIAMQKIDIIVEDSINYVKSNKYIDVEVYKELYNETNDLLSVENPSIDIKWRNAELFLTAWDLKTRNTIKNRKYRKKAEEKFIFYALATTNHTIELDVLNVFFNELNNRLRARFDRMLYKDMLIKAVKLNPKVSDEVKLWLMLQ
jgi:hypothetical protein